MKIFIHSFLQGLIVKGCLQVPHPPGNMAVLKIEAIVVRKKYVKQCFDKMLAVVAV
jgi:hypothetical protein